MAASSETKNCGASAPLQPSSTQKIMAAAIGAANKRSSLDGSSNSSAVRQKQDNPSCAADATAAAAAAAVSSLLANIAGASAEPAAIATPVVFQHNVQGVLTRDPLTIREVDLRIFEPVIVHANVYVPKAVENLTTMLSPVTEIRGLEVSQKELEEVTVDLNKGYLREFILKQIETLTSKTDEEKIIEITALLDELGPKTGLRPYMKYRDQPENFDLLRSLVVTSKTVLPGTNTARSVGVDASPGASRPPAEEAAPVASSEEEEVPGEDEQGEELMRERKLLEKTEDQTSWLEEIRPRDVCPASPAGTTEEEQEKEPGTREIEVDLIESPQEEAVAAGCDELDKPLPLEDSETAALMAMFGSEAVFLTAAESLREELSRVTAGSSARSVAASENAVRTSFGPPPPPMMMTSESEAGENSAGVAGLLGFVDLMRHLGLLLHGGWQEDEELENEYSKLQLVQRAALHNCMQVLLSKSLGAVSLDEHERFQLQRGVVSLLQSQAGVMEKEFIQVESGNLEEGGEEEVIRSIEVLMEADIQPEVWREKFCAPLTDEQREVMHRSIITILKTADVSKHGDPSLDDASTSLASTDSISGHARISEWQKHNLEMGILALVQTEFTKLSGFLQQPDAKKKDELTVEEVFDDEHAQTLANELEPAREVTSEGQETPAEKRADADGDARTVELMSRSTYNFLISMFNQDQTITTTTVENRAQTFAALAILQTMMMSNVTDPEADASVPGELVCDRAMTTLIEAHAEDMMNSALVVQEADLQEGLAKEQTKEIHKTTKYLFKNQVNVDKWVKKYASMSPEMQELVKFHLATFLEKNQSLEKKGQNAEALTEGRRDVLLQVRDAIAALELQMAAARQTPAAAAFNRISDEERLANRDLAWKVISCGSEFQPEDITGRFLSSATDDQRLAFIAHLQTLLAIGLDVSKILPRDSPLTDVQKANLEKAIEYGQTCCVQEEKKVVKEGDVEENETAPLAVESTTPLTDEKEILAKETAIGEVSNTGIVKEFVQDIVNIHPVIRAIFGSTSVEETKTVVPTSHPARYAYRSPAQESPAQEIEGTGGIAVLSRQAEPSTSDIGSLAALSPTIGGVKMVVANPVGMVAVERDLAGPVAPYTSTVSIAAGWQAAEPSMCHEVSGPPPSGGGGSSLMGGASSIMVVPGTSAISVGVSSGPQTGIAALPSVSPRWVWKVDERYRQEGPLSLSQQFYAATGMSLAEHLPIGRAGVAVPAEVPSSVLLSRGPRQTRQHQTRKPAKGTRAGGSTTGSATLAASSGLHATHHSKATTGMCC